MSPETISNLRHPIGGEISLLRYVCRSGRERNNHAVVCLDEGCSIDHNTTEQLRRGGKW